MRSWTRTARLALILCAASLSVTRAGATPPDVPLALWTDPAHPSGLVLGETMGVSWGDYDADGFIDIFACNSGNLWHNLGGVSWELAANLNGTLPPAERRYGSSFGDYDNDGRLDIATAPRIPAWGDDRMHLLQNLGGGPNFTNVAGDTAIVDVQPYDNAETLCWADVDGDGRLDLFVPVYPVFDGGGPGNFFLYNEGPLAPGGEWRFTESSGPAGLDNPPGTARPEGAQFADIDFDGDVDLYSNGTLYRNVSSPGMASFEVLPEAASGIGLSSVLDEGAMFFDYDLDGDDDLFVSYENDSVRIWESYGDGTFFQAEAGIIDAPTIGLNLGLSAEDWDNDGDIDFTTRQIFRRNMLVEEGARHFTVATHTILPFPIESATPAWGDFDNDGDLDCAMGNWGQDGHLYENTLYTSSTPPADRRQLQARIVGDAPGVPRGLEVAYGAVAEIHTTNVSDGFRRRKFVASSHGYLNQNQYALHFGVPDDPTPGDPATDVRFDLSVDFPSSPAEGAWRVDGHVNPMLYDLDLAALIDREIQVSRCGRVTVNGTLHEPNPFASPRLTTTTGGLASTAIGTVLTAPAPSPQSDWYVGLDFNTYAATAPVRLKEIILDGQLDTPQSCGTTDANLMLWDVTTSPATLVSGAALARQTSPRNRRSYFPTDITLAPGRAYRLVARVIDSRVTPIVAPVPHGGLTVTGGLAFRDVTLCQGPQVENAAVDAGGLAIAIRFADATAGGSPDVGPTLDLDRDPAGNPRLQWADVAVPGYQILRCDATEGPCTPLLHDASATTLRVDPDTQTTGAEILWYRVTPTNACTLELF